MIQATLGRIRFNGNRLGLARLFASLRLSQGCSSHFDNFDLTLLISLVFHPSYQPLSSTPIKLARRYPFPSFYSSSTQCKPLPTQVKFAHGIQNGR